MTRARLIERGMAWSGIGAVVGVYVALRYGWGQRVVDVLAVVAFLLLLGSNILIVRAKADAAGSAAKASIVEGGRRSWSLRGLGSEELNLAMVVLFFIALVAMRFKAPGGVQALFLIPAMLLIMAVKIMEARKSIHGPSDPTPRPLPRSAKDWWRRL